MIGCRAATGASDSADVARTCPSGSGRTGAWIGVMLVLLPRGYPDVPSYAPSYARRMRCPSKTLACCTLIETGSSSGCCERCWTSLGQEPDLGDSLAFHPPGMPARPGLVQAAAGRNGFGETLWTASAKDDAQLLREDRSRFGPLVLGNPAEIEVLGRAAVVSCWWPREMLPSCCAVSAGLARRGTGCPFPAWRPSPTKRSRKRGSRRRAQQRWRGPAG